MTTKHKSILTDILSEDFEMPIVNIDLQELIDASIEEYHTMAHNRKDTRLFRQKINLLINEYNERREFKCYNILK